MLVIPLGPATPGRVRRLPTGKFEIVVDAEIPIEEWVKELPALIAVAQDFSEANDLAARMPDTLEAMKKKFDEAAEKYHLYPLDDRGVARALVPKPPPPGADPTATRFTYYAGATRLPETAAPAIKNRSWTITANVKTEGTKTNGVIVAAGGVSSGITLYLKDGVPIFDYNYYGSTPC
jgi:arylsulfatase